MDSISSPYRALQGWIIQLFIFDYINKCRTPQYFPGVIDTSLHGYVNSYEVMYWCYVECTLLFEQNISYKLFLESFNLHTGRSQGYLNDKLAFLTLYFLAFSTSSSHVLYSCRSCRYLSFSRPLLTDMRPKSGYIEVRPIVEKENLHSSSENSSGNCEYHILM